MVVIEKEKCTGCGTCVKVCHEHCMSLVDGKVSINHAVCSTCTQCIAICAQKALSWDGNLPVGFDSGLLPSAAQIDELFMERRTVRDFTDESIDRGTLAEIVSCGAYAPTHNFTLRCIIVDDPVLIQAFDTEAFEFSKRIYNLVFRPGIIRALAALASSPVRDEFRKAMPKLEAAVARGKGYKSRPAALVCVVADRRIPLSLESAQYALSNMSLYAQVKGVGCRNLVGNQVIFNRSREIRRGLRLARHDRLVAVAGFGVPAVKFRNKVTGKKMQIQWNGEATAAL
jgi:ferredoxin